MIPGPLTDGVTLSAVVGAYPAVATRARRAIAVFVDTIVFFALWTAIGFIATDGPLLYTAGVYFVVDVVLTAVLGVSVGRLVTGIRVARQDGSRPGLVPALIRTALVFVSGWAGLFAFSWFARLGVGNLSRLWWDRAAGTQLVMSRVRGG